MKIGNIKEVIEQVGSKWREATTVKGNMLSENLERTIKALPKDNLDEYFQKKFNKNVDYDQWAGIREELESMGRTLYSKTLTIMGDAIFLIQGDNQEKIFELERQVKDLQKEKEDLESILKKYID